MPEWIKGHTDSTSIKIVITKTIEYSAQIAMHELVHYLIYQKRKQDGYRILDEGMASYLARQMTANKMSSVMQDYPEFRSIRYFLNINNNPQEFAENKGYAYSYFLVKFILEKYSKTKLMEYILDKDKFMADIDILEEGYREYLLKLKKKNDNKLKHSIK